MSKNTTKTIRQIEWTDAYGFRGETSLVESGGRHYILHDSLSGTNSPEGGAERTFVYGVPDERVGEVAGLFDGLESTVESSSGSPRLPRPRQQWDDLCHTINVELESMGRKRPGSFA